MEAARAAGESDLNILFRYLLPNSMAPIIIQTTLRMATVLLTASGAELSRPGGPAPARRNGGPCCRTARPYLITAPHVATVPGLAIMLVVMGFNLFGDGLRDSLDPRIEGLTRMATSARDQQPPGPTFSRRAGSSEPWTVIDLRDPRRGSLRAGGGDRLRQIGHGPFHPALDPGPAGKDRRGEIRFKEGIFSSLSADEMRACRGKEISMIFQEPMTSLNPVFRIGEQMAEVIRLHQGLVQGEALEDRRATCCERVRHPDARAVHRAIPAPTRAVGCGSGS